MNPLPLALCASTEDCAKFEAGRHVMEPKLDGVRLQVIVAGAGDVRLYTRSQHAATGKLPRVEHALHSLSEALAGTVLDGEGVFLADDGSADFNWTARCLGSGVVKCQQKQQATGKHVSFVAFDIMFLQGTDVRHLPLADRRALLEKVVALLDCRQVVCTEQAPVSRSQHVEFTQRFGEGSVIKDLTAPYAGGTRRGMWKWKKAADEDVVIMGGTPGKGKFEGQVGAVVFGQVRSDVPAGFKELVTPLPDGRFLVERGQCSGMTDTERQWFTDNLDALVARQQVMVITHNGLQVNTFRHPQFHRLRDDKLAEQCEWTEA